MNEAESALLGAAILDPRALDVVGGIVNASDFEDTPLGQTFALMQDMHDAGESTSDTTLLVARLRTAGLLELVGGRVGVAQWAMNCPNAQNAGEYARTIKAASSRRKLAALAGEIASRVNDPLSQPADVVDWIEAQLTRHRTDGVLASQTLAGAMQEAIDDIVATKNTGRVSGLSTGLQTLDGAIGGLYPGELVILAARPSIGKTALGTGIALHNASAGRETMFVSLEMPGRDIAIRHLAALLGYEVRVLRSGRVHDDDIDEMRRHQQAERKTALHIFSTRSATMAKIRAAAKVHQATRGLSLLVVDYLGLIQPRDRRKPRWEAITEISGELKSLALELSIPVLCLCQLNREAEKGKPTLAHLRDAGAIEQDADVVMLLHRESRDSTTATIDVAKCRNGATGEIVVAYDCQATKFSDVQRDAYDQFA